MNRSHTNGELNQSHVGQNVQLMGWVAKRRNLGSLVFIDLRDRYGITQLAFNEEIDKDMNAQARSVSREFVIQVTGTVIERESKNKNNATGEIEILVKEFKILNELEESIKEEVLNIYNRIN